MRNHGVVGLMTSTGSFSGGNRAQALRNAVTPVTQSFWSRLWQALVG